MDPELARIVARKQQELTAARAAVPIESLRARVADLERPRNFFSALVAADDPENDVLVDEYQIWESRAAGADAILLRAEVLAEAPLIDSLILATELGLTSLVVAHDVENLLTARTHVGFPHPGYGLLGIDNRNPATGETAVAHSFRLAELIEERDILVSVSGISTREDLRKLREHGVNIVLLGESLLDELDIERSLLRLLGENV
jgi:indole-3-glycerol phosphate synthase